MHEAVAMPNSPVPEENLGCLLKPSTGQKWPIRAYDRDGELRLMGMYHEFHSTLEKAVRSNYVLDSDCSELVSLFMAARRAPVRQPSVSREEFRPESIEGDVADT